MDLGSRSGQILGKHQNDRRTREGRYSRSDIRLKPDIVQPGIKQILEIRNIINNQIFDLHENTWRRDLRGTPGQHCYFRQNIRFGKHVVEVGSRGSSYGPFAPQTCLVTQRRHQLRGVSFKKYVRCKYW